MPDDVQAAAVQQQPHSWSPSACKGCAWRRRTWINQGRLDDLQVCLVTSVHPICQAPVTLLFTMIINALALQALRQHSTVIA